MSGGGSKKGEPPAEVVHRGLLVSASRPRGYGTVTVKVREPDCPAASYTVSRTG